MPVLRDWDLMLNVEQVLRAQGADPEKVQQRKPGVAALAERALREGLPLLQPVVAYSEFGIRRIIHERVEFKEGGSLSGKIVALQLAAARGAAIVVCSLGGLLEEYIRAVFKTDAAYGLALDAVGSAAIQELSVKICSVLGEKAAARGWETTLPFSPGMENWPAAEAHQALFKLLDPSLAGITITTTGMMVPIKSLSLVLGFGPEVDNSGRICDYCTMRNTCRYQDIYEHNI